MASSQPVAPPRHSRGYSFSGKSNKSGQSGHSSKKIQLTESADEKHRRHLHTKADPMVAMSEAQPNTVALEQSTLGSLRTMQHKDQYGNIITDPDLSNPTRPRFERPLDTIRSFEAAIYGTYSSRPVSYARTEESTPATPEYSRRGSYYGAPNGGHSSRAHHDQNGYPNGRGTYSRPDSYVENGNGQADNYYPYNQGGGSGRPRPPRQTRMNTEQNGYSQHAYQKSYDNVTAASGSGSGSNGEAWGNSTDPSSVNSSMDQFQQQQQQQQYQQQQMAESVGFQGFGAGPNLEGGQPAAGGRINFGSSNPSAIDPNAGGPVGGGPPPTAANNRRHLRKATNDSEMSNDSKRKSWFKRRFSKN
ncbi:uncharacterized protein BP01DRAFT_372085 [Aspergillus saccharolyticus JOP 1030-1]|uniref:Uncharacterized protein n=1 Tax=Aspergillus saccharolyticus JOP 1030-1 TaxID=1450539 RepID=A0A318ZN49_9EURO|nr:hypothetical protein BP01DRAFT_372085 [Aspergillus saccharolyticus JOP 1030-1]PYH47924.1 hypothetical protein BP01DRAFT_372085 [Aspergillus saccharolyticus JOP 1030-1]